MGWTNDNYGYYMLLWQCESVEWICFYSEENHVMCLSENLLHPWLVIIFSDSSGTFGTVFRPQFLDRSIFPYQWISEWELFGTSNVQQWNCFWNLHPRCQSRPCVTCSNDPSIFWRRLRKNDWYSILHIQKATNAVAEQWLLRTDTEWQPKGY